MRAPLALAVLCEELDALDRRIEALERATDQGVAKACLADLVVAVDRHLELERGVLLPVFEREGLGIAEFQLRHARIRRAAEVLDGADAPRPAGLADLRSVLADHRARVEAGFARAERKLGSEIEALGYELDEVRQRLRGSYGV